MTSFYSCFGLLPDRGFLSVLDFISVLELILDAFDLFEGVSLGDVEFGDGGAAQGFQMRAAAEALAHFVGDGAHVGSGGDAGAKVGAVAIDSDDFEFLDLDLHRLQD